MPRPQTCLHASALVLPLLAACGRADDHRLGSQPEPVIARSEGRDDDAAPPLALAGRDAAPAGSRTDPLVNKALDAAISADIKSRLARDDTLGALGIDVDTAGGRVVLRGSVPDTSARALATELARQADGVVDIRNDLNVQRTH